MGVAHVALLILLVCGLKGSLADVPHVSQCKRCRECWVDTPGEPSQRYDLLSGADAENPDLDYVKFATQRIKAPTKCKWDPRSVRLGAGSYKDPSKPEPTEDCPRCRGCTAALTNISSVLTEVAGVKVRSGIGGTDNWLFYATKHGSDQRYVVKASCMGYSKITGQEKHCNPRNYAQRLQVQVAQYLIAEDCGLGHLLHKTWVERTIAIVPGTGMILDWDMLWMEPAKGLSLHGLQQSNKRPLIYDLLHTKLNRSQIVEAAIWDLLVAQCDRHIENIFINLDGNIQLIDHDKALGTVPTCGSNSMLLPGNGFHGILRTRANLLEMARFDKIAKKEGICSPEIDPRITLDYRCMVPGGELGTAYPPSMQQCLKKLAALSVEQMCERYRLPGALGAVILKARATDMLAKGFEWTLRNGPPLNTKKLTLEPQPPCCKLLQHKTAFFCGHCWQPLTSANATYNHFKGP